MDALQNRRASFVRLRMRDVAYGIEKTLMLSLSKHAGRLSQSLARRPER
jgi:hypothetical protein